MGKIRKISGFTLIELVVVSGIMVLFSITLISVFMASFSGGSKAQLIQAVRQNGDFAIKTMAQEIRAAESVVCDNDQLTVNRTDGATILYDLSGERVASDSSFLTGPVADLTAGSFNCYNGQVGNQIVTIRFSLIAGDEDAHQVQEKLNQSFATSVSTRQY
ncbi:MAG: hypothetical protein V1810_03180 [Candidatus Beckwithbacteria bacterium]